VVTATARRDRLAGQLMTALSGLRRVVRQRLRPGVSGPPLRGAQVELLQVVDANPGIGVAAAARALHLADNSVSTLVNQLVTAGLLNREVHPHDRRAARLRVTGAAHERLDAWRRRRAALVAEAIGALSDADVAAIEAALPALSRLVISLESAS